MLSNLFRCEGLAWIPEGDGVLPQGEAVRYVPCTGAA